MRGVYAPLGSDDGIRGGSSPHTRGLHGRPPPRRAGQRIIPAHAGFTRPPLPVMVMVPDHPRTRGVYSSPAVVVPKKAGSSPHTRGLRSWPRPPAAAAMDHPRTRGVYNPADAITSQAAGSSPHTRGLRSLYRGQPGRLRIIPAHAGFTPWPSTAGWTRRDHPRTRGVYG